MDVAEELEHIHRGNIGDHQMHLRNLYEFQRLLDARSGKTKEETLLSCIDYLRKLDSSFEPTYDRKFFKVNGHPY